jgi:hypothetical protein
MTQSISLPSSALGGGYLLLQVDANNDQLETDESTDHIKAVAVNSKRPDLVLTDLSVTPGASQTLSLSWTVKNQGDFATSSNWSDYVFYSQDNVLSVDDVYVTHFNPGSYGNIPLAPDGSYTMTQSISLPSSALGGGYLLLQVDANNDQLETDESTDHIKAVAINKVNPGTIQFSDTAYSINENGTPVTEVTLTRTEGSDGEITARINLSDIIATAGSDYYNNSIIVNFADGETTKTVTIPIIDDNNFENTETLQLTLANPTNGATIGTQNSAIVSIIDNDFKATLTVNINADQINEGNSIQGTVTRNTDTTEALTVTLINSDNSQLTIPTTVTIPIGSTSANFTITAVDDTLIELPKNYTVIATAQGFVSSSDTLAVLDNDAVTLSLSIETNNINENGGKILATVTRNIVTDTPLQVQLSSNDTTEATVPSTVIIGANQASVTFEITGVDDLLLDGTQSVIITAKPTYTSSNLTLDTGNATTTINVIDNESPSLQITIDKDVISETGTATATITRNTDTNSELIVTLTSSDTSEATVPNTVTIPIGQTSATVTITGVSDGINDGSQSVTITASSNGLNSGTDNLEITDINVPDLAVTQLQGVSTTYTSKQAQFTYTVANNGIISATGSWSDRVYLSTDNILDANDTLLGEFALGSTETPANLLPGTSYDRTVTYYAPRTPGNYYLIATTDSGNTVNEGLNIGENNNTTITPISITPAYRALAYTDTETNLAGTPITLRGQALSNSDNSPVTFEFVKIRVENKGTIREFDAFTDANGNFVGQFNPLPGEAGTYNINAYFPGVATEDTVAEDSFTLLGMRFEENDQFLTQVSQRITEGTTLNGSVKLQNLSNIELSGLTASINGAPSDWTVTLTPEKTNLLGNEEITVNYSINVPNDNWSYYNFSVGLNTTQGVTANLPIRVDVTQLLPRLVADTNSLQASMLRGGQTLVEFTVSNQGDIPSGPLNIVLPDASWLKLASPVTLSSLNQGESVKVSLLLQPSATQDLTVYNGNVVIAGAETSLSLPFNFRAISEAKGNLNINVVDELFFFAEGSPTVQNATITLLDPFTGTVIFSEQDADGILAKTDLAEGYYTLRINANNHDSYQQNIYIGAGETEDIQAFLSRQTVKYTWTVTPTEIQDQYTISIQSTFETDVPIPIVTVNPSAIDLGDLQVVGQVIQVDMVLTNQGLIAANNVKLNFGEHPFYKIEPLINDFQNLAAKSSVTVPVKITRIADFADFPESTSIPCSLSGYLNWSYTAGNNDVQKSSAIAFNNVEGNCFDGGGFFDVISGGGGGFVGGGGGGGFVGGGGGGSYFSPTPITIDSPASVSAKVTVKIDQDAVMTRAAFLGNLEISNGNSTKLENLSVTLQIKDANGNIVNDLFGITSPILNNITAVDGTGILIGDNPNTPQNEGLGSAQWTFIPTNLAAPEIPTQYGIGGSLSYLENGVTVTVPLLSTPVTVYPQAELYLDYFHQRDVFADDPFTTQIETSVPYELAVLVKNQGKGVAKNLKITSGQPKIIENEKGLLIDFQIIGSEVNGQGVSPSLTVDFGNIDAGGTAVADWLLKSTLQGKFIDYKATFEHINSLGKAELSLIKEVKIHELIHSVNVNHANPDNLDDFLVNETIDDQFTPDIIYFSSGGTAPVKAVKNATIDSPATLNDLTVQISATVENGWTYFRLAEPSNSQFDIVKILRSDGTEIGLDNLWTTDRTFPETGRPTYENILHFVDNTTAGNTTYTIVYTPGGPTVTDIIDVSPDPIANAVNAITVDFSEAIQLSSFDYNDLSLTLNGGSNLINSTVGIVALSATRYQITGLSGLTNTDGEYNLTVNATGIQDSGGKWGQGSLNETWTKTVTGTSDSTAPVVTDIVNLLSNPRNQTVSSLTVNFSEKIDLSTFTWQDITLTRDSGTNLVNSAVTVTAINDTSYRINGLTSLTATDGGYTLTVNGSGIQDLSGNAGTGTQTENWVMDTIAPTTPINVTVTNGLNPLGASLAPLQTLNVAGQQVINTMTPTISGELGETGLKVFFYDKTTNTLLQQATVTGTQFAGTVTLPSPGARELDLQVQDAAGNATTTTLSLFADISGNQLNQLPIVNNITKTVDEDKAIAFTGSDFSFGFSDPDGNSLNKIQITSLPNNGTLSFSNTSVTINQEINFADLGNLTFTPALNFNGIVSFNWNGFDGTVYATNPAAVNITVNAVNDNPTITSGTIANFAENGTSIAYIITASDPDLGTSLIYTLETNPDASLFNVNNTTGAITFKNAPDFETPLDTGNDNTYNLTVTANDGSLTSSKAVALTVTDLNEIKGDPLINNGRNPIVGTAGPDYITGGPGAKTLTGGGGNDSFVFTDMRDVGQRIADFTVGEDKLVFTQLFSSLGYKGSNPIADSYIKFVQGTGANSAHTFLQIDRDGLTGSAIARNFLQVDNLTPTQLNNINNFQF